VSAPESGSLTESAPLYLRVRSAVPAFPYSLPSRERTSIAEEVSEQLLAPDGLDLYTYKRHRVRVVSVVYTPTLLGVDQLS
jgi:hypothetical protein